MQDTELNANSASEAQGADAHRGAKVSQNVAGVAASVPEPRVYDFLDYREFLKAFRAYRVSQGRVFSSAAFARRAGLESPNYWGLIVAKKRNLSPETVQKFMRALGLKDKEAHYFENLVYFNQSRSNDERQSYFERLKILGLKEESRSFDLLASHVELLSKWYIIAIRELVGLGSFIEDEAWIAKKLRNKVSRKEVREAIGVLLKLGFVSRDPGTKKLQQSEPHLNYRESGANFAIQNLHEQFLAKAAESLKEDSPESRNMTSSTISVSASKMAEMKDDVRTFTEQLCLKYGSCENNKHANADSVIQINTQLFFLTEAE